MDSLYVHRAPVRFTHTDPAGYVFFPRFFEMFQAAVEDWFTHCLGLNYAEQILRHGIAASAASDGGLARLVLEQVGRSSMTLRFDGSVHGEARLRARSVLVAIEMQHGRPQPIASVLRERLQAYLALCEAHA